MSLLTGKACLTAQLDLEALEIGRLRGWSIKTEPSGQEVKGPCCWICLAGGERT